MADQFNILDYTDAPLLKTGQTTKYTPAGSTTKDDGGFQRGIAGSKLDEQYQILTTGQYSGTTNITVNGFTDAHSNECVFDKVTGLMWNRTATPGIYGTGAEDLLWDDIAGNNEDIFEYCDQADLSALSSFSDWRVPNSMELQSLLKAETPAPLINDTAFPTWPVSRVQTSSTRPNSITNYLAVSFIDSGIAASNTKTSTRLPGCLVRLGIE